MTSAARGACAVATYACLSITACSEGSSARPTGGDASGAPKEAPVNDAGPVDLAAIGGRALDSLSALELRAVCEENARRSDSCREAAYRTTTTPLDCQASVASCRARYGDGGFRPDCSGSSFGTSGSCGVTVDEYLACSNAFAGALSCDVVGRRVAPPECAVLKERCDALSLSFFVNGTPPPCTPEESVGKPPDTNDDIYGADGCRPVPARFVVLGDSIAACTGTGQSTCAPYLIADYLRQNGAPNLAFETHAVNGARIADLVPQASEVTGGPGHVYVWTYAIGNDLLAQSTDTAAFIGGYAAMFDYFTDTARFPDGATFLLNTLYNPSDECMVPGGFAYGPGADALVRRMNQAVFIDVAIARPDTVAVDQLPDFLGHGANANLSGCPHCGADNAQWVVINHPNELGHAHMAEKWEVALSSMIGARCRDR